MEIAFDRLPGADLALMKILARPLRLPPHSVTDYTERGREDHDLFYHQSGQGVYYQGGKQIYELQKNDILLLPKNERYRTVATGSEPVTGLFVRFILLDEGGNCVRFSDALQCLLQDPEEALLPYFQRLVTLSLRTVGQLKAKACLSELLSEIIRLRLTGQEGNWLTASISYMGAHLQGPLRLEELAARAFMSERTFCRKFKEATGLPPIAYQRRLRVQKAQELLSSGYYTLEDAAAALGFTDAAHLSRCFYQETGVRAGSLRRGAR